MANRLPPAQWLPAARAALGLDAPADDALRPAPGTQPADHTTERVRAGDPIPVGRLGAMGVGRAPERGIVVRIDGAAAYLPESEVIAALASTHRKRRAKGDHGEPADRKLVCLGECNPRETDHGFRRRKKNGACVWVCIECDNERIG